MKRIFVMMLACLMLLSVVPFSVFATEVDHEHEEGCQHTCPGNDKEHSLELSTDPKAIETVEGNCGEFGYTVYQCECGKTFAANFVKSEKDAHKWVETAAKVEPTCTATGKEAAYKCSECGATKGGKTIAVKAHAYENGKCKDCGIDAPVVDTTCKHTNLKNPTVISKPACCVPGEMQYTCADCDEIIKVEIAVIGYTEIIVPAKAPTCEATGLTEGKKCSECGRVLVAQENVAATGHAYDDGKITKAPSCDKDGVKVYTCQNDKNHTVKETVPATHTWSSVQSTAPTCTRPGISYRFCEVCGYYDDEITPIPATGHTLPEGFEVPEIPEGLMCHQEFSYTYNCATCAEAVKVVLKAKESHDFVETVIQEATCLLVEQKVEKCTKCGYYDANKIVYGKEKNPENHNFESVIINAATCTKAGNMIGYCACGEATDIQIIPATGHNYSEVVSETEATCTVAGKKVVKCSCGATKTTTTPKLGHIVVKGEIVPATCYKAEYYVETCEREGCTYSKEVKTGKTFTFDYEKVYASVEDATKDHGQLIETGYSMGDCNKKGYVIYTCTSCNNNVLVIVEGTGIGHKAPENFNCKEGYVCQNPWCGEFVAPANHKYEVTTAPTCTEVGEKTCSECGAKAIVAAKGHKVVIDPAVAPTCTETGLTEGKHCSVCEAVLIPQIEISALGHKWTDKEVVEVGCENDGYTYQECSVCAATQTINYQFKTGHKAQVGEELIDIIPGCEAECVCGLEECVCRYCVGCETVIETHKLVEEIIDATCEKEGYIMHVCSVCGKYEISDITEKADHIFAVVETVAPTYMPGKTVSKCEVCGIVDTKESDPVCALGLTLSIDNAVKSGAGYSDSSLVAVKVNLNAVNTKVWGVTFNLTYNKNIVTFVDSEFVSDDFKANQKVNAGDGYIKVVATTENTADKKTQNAVIEGEEAFVILTFRVKLKGSDITAKELSTAFGFTNIEVLNNAAKDNKVETIGYGETIKIVRFLDVNGDGDVTLADALAVAKILASETDYDYDVAADVDKDGEVTAKDLLDIYSFLAEEVKYAELTKLGA